MATGKALDGKPYAGNPHVRFDEGEVAPAAKPRRGSLLYKMLDIRMLLATCAAFISFAAQASASDDVRLEGETSLRIASRRGAAFFAYAYGCVLEWLFSAAAGIRPDQERGGWKRFVLRPYPDRRPGSCSATYRSDFGTIRSAWQYGDDGSLTWRFSVPEGSTALVTAPDGTTGEYAAGDYELKY